MRVEVVESEREKYQRTISDKAEVHFISSLDENRPWHEPPRMLEGVDGVIFGGSGDFDFDGGREMSDPARVTSKIILERVRPLVEHLLSQDLPLFGVCYGHQIVAEVKGTAVLHDKEQTKRGSFPVILTQAGVEDAVFGSLPETFVGQYGHKDSLSGVPDGAVLLANSAICRASALRYGTSGYTVQFHPELSGEDMKSRLLNSPGLLPEGVDIDAIIKQSPEASSLIPNFIDRIVR